MFDFTGANAFSKKKTKTKGWIVLVTCEERLVIHKSSATLTRKDHFFICSLTVERREKR